MIQAMHSPSTDRKPTSSQDQIDVRFSADSPLSAHLGSLGRRTKSHAASGPDLEAPALPFVSLHAAIPAAHEGETMSISTSVPPQRKRPRGRPPIPIVEHPDPLWEAEVHPLDFHGALDLQMRRHGDAVHRLHRAVKAAGGLTDRKTISDWRRGIKTPQTPASLKVLDLIEHRYRLPPVPPVAAPRDRRTSAGGRGAVRGAAPGMASARRLQATYASRAHRHSGVGSDQHPVRRNGLQPLSRTGLKASVLPALRRQRCPPARRAKAQGLSAAGGAARAST